MNKFLAEQLLEFNKESNDQYRENWGSILNFVHEDPHGQGYEQGHNNSSIDIFQRQMKQKEQQLLEEKARKEAAAKQSSDNAQATRYQNDEKERIRAMVEDARQDGISVAQLTHVQFSSGRQEQDGIISDKSITRQESQNLSNQTMSLDRSIHEERSLQQQVSFKADLLQTKKQRTTSVAIKNVDSGSNKPRSPKTPAAYTSNFENLAQNTVQEPHSAMHKPKAIKSIVKKPRESDRNNNYSAVEEYQDSSDHYGQAKKPSFGNLIVHTQGVKQTVRKLTMQNHMRGKVSKTSQLWNTQKDKKLADNLRPFGNQNNESSRLPVQVRQMESSPWIKSQEIQADQDDGYSSPEIIEEPINLSNLQTLNLRGQLMSRLRQFNDKKRSEANEEPDLDSNRFNSTQDSLFLQYERSGNVPHGMMTSGRKQQVYSQSQPRRPSRQQFMKKHGKDLASSNYMQSMMKIHDDLVDKRGHKSTLMQAQRRSSMNYNGANVAASEASQSQHMGNESENHTANFGRGQSRKGGVDSRKQSALAVQTPPIKMQEAFKKQSRFASQMRMTTKSSQFQQFAAQEYDVVSDNKKSTNRTRQNIPCSFTKQPKKDPLDEAQCYIHQNHLKMVTRHMPNRKHRSQNRSTMLQMNHTGPNFNLMNSFDTNQSGGSPFVRLIDDEQRQIKKLDLNIRRRDSGISSASKDISSAFAPFGINQVPLPNQSNAFFASGGKWIDPTWGQLEDIYQGRREGQKSVDEGLQRKILQNYKPGKPAIDRTNQMLKRLQMQTPEININRDQLRRIAHQSKNKVSYPYRERYCGIYEDKKRNGELERKNSWEDFVNPVKVGLNNHLQQAYNSEASENLIRSQQNQQANQDNEKGKSGGNNPNKPQTAQESARTVSTREGGVSDQQSAHQRPGAKTQFRNDLERFHYQFDQEHVQNINDATTFDRIQKANKRFETVIQRAKPSIKLYNLLGYSRAQYILFRQIQHWMRTHQYSDKKQTDNINNIQFAREFFAIIDDNDSGSANLQQLAVPMIALGLSSDSSFIKKVMKAISPNKFGKKAKTKNPFQDNLLTLKEFIKIFKKDQVSENLTEMLCSRIIERRKYEHFEKKRAMERRKKQLSIVQGHSQYAVTKIESDNEDIENRPTTAEMALYEMVAEDTSDLDLQRAETTTFVKMPPDVNDNRGTSALDKTAGHTTGLSEVKEVKKEQSMGELLRQLAQISINDMLLEVRSLWFELDDDRGLLELDMVPVCQKLCSLGVMQDVSSASKYIQTTIQSKTKMLDYDDFNSIFCKGIFRHSIVSKAQQIEQETAQNPDANPEEKLEFKMARTKNLNLTNEIRKGRIDHADQPAQLVVRPILSELWAIFYKNVPREERETYEQFFNRMQGLTNEVIFDPASVELDAFSAKHREANPPPARYAMGMVAQHNVEMAMSPYEDDNDSQQQRKQSQKSTVAEFSSKRARRRSTKKGDSLRGSFRGGTNSQMNSPGRGSKDGRESSSLARSARRTVQTTQQARQQQQDDAYSVSQTKSQIGTAASKQRQDNMSSHRTEASSRQMQATTVKFNEPASNIGNLDLKLSDDVEDLIMQRKQRFESLRQLQGLMERTDIEKPPGYEFLEDIYRRKEEEKRLRFEQAEKDKA